VREVGYGLSLEGASSADLVKSMRAKTESVARRRKGRMTTKGSISSGRGRSAMVVPTATSIERREREISASQPEISRGNQFLR
jgi:hypothetical protein